MADDLNNENNIIIARQQQRRGLKQDLPQPLRPGELGFTTDSQQLYIGTDTSAPGSSKFNTSSTFEVTVNARQHAISIANNQVIAFTVPFIKYSNGEYSGATTVKQWQPTFARSVISATKFPESEHTSSDKPVFATKDTKGLQTTLSNGSTATLLVSLTNDGGLDNTGNIRVGDQLVIGTSNPITVNVTDVYLNTGTGEYELTVDSLVTASATTPANVFYNSIKNIFTGQTFKSTDMIVSKNGLRLNPDVDNTNIGVPGPSYDYTFSSTDASNTGIHQLILASAPTPADEVTVCYYSNVDVISAIEGNPVTGNISAYSNIPSFYTEYSIPKYRQFAPENIRLSTTSGLGYIGLDRKHIEAVAESSGNVDSTTGLVFGNLLISRDDIAYDSTNAEIVPSITDQFTVIVSNLVAGQFSPITEQSGAYRYNRIKVTIPSNTSRYFHNKHFNLLAVDGVSGLLNFEIPTKPFSLAREVDINLASVVRYPGNGYTGSGTDTVATIFGSSAGVEVGDWIRVVDAAGTNELHDTVFRVIASRAGQVDIRVAASSIASGNVVPNFTQNHSGLGIVNHGAVEGNIDTTIQAYVTAGTELTNEVTQVVIEDIPLPYANGNANISVSNQTPQTFYLEDYAVNGGDQMATATGNFHPLLDANYTNTLKITPVLSINLQANTTLAEAVTTINKPLVSTKIGVEPEGILPLMDYATQDNGDLNRVFLTQDPAYTSVDVGGIEFSLFEDRDIPTLSTLKLSAGSYTRDEFTVRAKLEKWLNQTLLGRDVNLISSVLTSNLEYKNFPYSENESTNRYYQQVITNKMGSYNLVIDDTYNDVLFSSRQEAASFNNIVNRIYSESPFDRSEDSLEGTKGLLNIRTNIEIQTRSQADIGAATLNFPTMAQALILRTQLPNTEVFRLPIGVYNTYIVEYTLHSTGSTAIDTYTRIGSMLISVNTDINDTAINDRFSSVYNKVDGAEIVEPRFQAVISGNDLIITMEEQFRTPSLPVPGDTLAHSFDCDILFKYVTRRWTSYEV